MFEIRDIDLHGRTGRLFTQSGVIETPAFFPVVDIHRQEVPLDVIREVGFNQVITNAYIYYKRLEREGSQPRDIHEVLGFNGVVMTDSGAYQILHYGRHIPVSQSDIIRFQQRINSDISVILDIPTGKVSRHQAEMSVKLTLERAREAVPLLDDKRIWVLPIQGGEYLDLVALSAKKARELDKYGMYGIGSPTVFLEKYEFSTVLRIVKTAKRYLKEGLPVHLFGAGHPLLIPYAVALGVDTFDSASYILYARDGRIFTNLGVDRIDRVNRIVCPCNIYGKRTYSSESLLSMSSEDRTRILATYNLCYIWRTMEETREHLREGRLWDLLEAYSKHHPRIYEAYLEVATAQDLLLSSSPRIKGVVRGVRVYDKTSILNPKIKYYSDKIYKYNFKINNRRKVVLRPLPRNPEECRNNEENVYVLYYDPILLIVPEELCGVYPTIHIHAPENTINQLTTSEVIEKIRQLLAKILDPSIQVEVEASGRLGYEIENYIKIVKFSR